MKTSNKGISLIKKFEGCRKTAYLDTAGVPTIGYGHTKNVKIGDKLSLQACEKLLLDDIAVCEKELNKYITRGYIFNQNQYDALISFCFNLGAGNLQKLLSGRKNNNTAIAEAIPKYCHAKFNGKKLSLAGLIRRRTEEKKLFCAPCENVSSETLSFNDVVINTIKGKYGNGEKRKNNITALGFDYYEVQKEVNKILRIINDL